MTTTHASATTITGRTNEDLVRTFIDEFWNGGSAEAVRLLAPEYVDHAYDPAGVAGLLAARQELTTAFPDHRTSIEALVAQDDLVIVRLVVRATHQGPFRGTAPSGSSIEVRAYRTYRLADGRIAEHWALLDTLSLLRQIGALAQPAQACAR